MLALSPPSMQRSEPAKLSSKKARTLVPADYSDVDETDLRRFALKRSSLEKALRWTDGAPAQNSSVRIYFLPYRLSR
jgi:hypothetical protein